MSTRSINNSLLTRISHKNSSSGRMITNKSTIGGRILKKLDMIKLRIRDTRIQWAAEENGGRNERLLLGERARSHASDGDGWRRVGRRLRVLREREGRVHHVCRPSYSAASATTTATAADTDCTGAWWRLRRRLWWRWRLQLGLVVDEAHVVKRNVALVKAQEQRVAVQEQQNRQ